MTIDVFNTDDTPPSNPLEQLVGADKKFKTVEELAAGKAHADQFIDHLKSENAQLREQLEKTNISQELYEKLITRTEQPASSGAALEPAAKPAITDEDLVNRIRAVRQEDDKQAQVTANATNVANKLIELYGDADKANALVKQKAQELGVSVSFLQEVAANSPTAFFNTIGLDSAPKPQPFNRGDVNPQGFERASNSSKPGSKESYEQLRKDNPSLYFSAKVQNQLYKDKLAGNYIP